ncbi:MAG: hypothetical protein JSV25_00020 [Spirochaetota bacterium]|nr:MAG: hypothetical protein JSV25_00020 [Spirochaetota bacterium]
MRMTNYSRTPLRKFVIFISFFMLFFTLLINCPARLLAQTKGGHLVYGTWQTPDTLDVQSSSREVVFAIAWSYLDPLIRTRPGESWYYPGLARKWNVSSDAKEYTFFLRKDVKFHDGTFLTADAVKFSFDRIMNSRMKTKPVSLALGPYDRCEVVDKHTVKIYFKKPYGSFIQMASTVYIPIISPDAVKQFGGGYQFHVTGTGPFILEEYIPKSHATFVRNMNYHWGPHWSHEGPAYLDKVTYSFIPEDITRIGSLRTRETNLIDGVKSNQIYSVVRDKRLEIELTQLRGMPWAFVLNSQRFPTDDRIVRQAISYTIDRERLIDPVYRGTNEPAYSPLEKGTLGYNKAVDKLSVYDPQKAKELLEQAGWKKGADGIRVKDNRRLIVEAALPREQQKLSTVLQSQLKKIGLELVIKEQSIQRTHSIWSMKNYNMVLTSSYWPDPQLLNNWFAYDSNGELNWAHYINPKLGDLFLEAENTIFKSRRAEIYKGVQEFLIIDAVVIPLFGKSEVYGVRKEIEGIDYSITGYPIFYETYFTE